MLCTLYVPADLMPPMLPATRWDEDGETVVLGPSAVVADLRVSQAHHGVATPAPFGVRRAAFRFERSLKINLRSIQVCTGDSRLHFVVEVPWPLASGPAGRRYMRRLQSELSRLVEERLGMLAIDPLSYQVLVRPCAPKHRKPKRQRQRGFTYAPIPASLTPVTLR